MLLSAVCLVLSCTVAQALVLAEDEVATVTVTLGESATAEERSAARIVRSAFWRLARAELQEETADETPRANTIAIGTPQTHPVIDRMARNGQVQLDGLGDEGYHITLTQAPGTGYVAIAANGPRGALYGAYAFVEALVAERFGKSPVDMDFRMLPEARLALDRLSARSRPFYPVRMTLEKETPTWLGAHRVNMSGAEGVWSGTGINDGIGAAFQYVSGFAAYQDASAADRRFTIGELRYRTEQLAESGIESYLFMYLTGEPTKALILRRPDLLGPEVPYAASRNGESYRPFCWSNPDVRALFASLTQTILRTYPNLTGLHLRAWGFETRACKCPECGQNDAEGQDLLWQIVFTIIDAARDVRPSFKLLLSGYDRSWLQDPDRLYLRRLPTGTVLLRKWGVDGEPTADPTLPLDLLHDIDDAGHLLVVLSHDAEEVQPLWMIEAELFARGVTALAANADARGLGGFSLQGQIGLGTLDKRVSARLNWDPHLNVVAYLTNALEDRYGADAAMPLLSGLLKNALLLSDFFLDYGGILTRTGGYRRGSTGVASRLWTLFGVNAVKDVVQMPDAEAVNYALRRMNELLPAQAAATQAIHRAVLLSRDPEDVNLLDAVNLMEMWAAYFASRRALVEAVSLGFTTRDEAAIRERIDEAIRQSSRAQARLGEIQIYASLIQTSAEAAKGYIVGQIALELVQMRSIDPATLIRPGSDIPDDEPSDPDTGPGSEGFGISDMLLVPSPVRGDGASFVYTLVGGVDTLIVDIYSPSGRRVRRVDDLPTSRGYQEAYWDGRDADGKRIANGAYFYRAVARRRDLAATRVGRFAVLR